MRLIHRAALLTAALGLPLLATPSAGAATPSPVISPKPGARLPAAQVRLVVRAGREHEDLRATLNGVRIGPDFARVGRWTRRLSGSHSHGLRHGTNVLRVTARTNKGVRRATVRFTLAGRRTLVGAGRDSRAVVGVPTRIRGKVTPRRGRLRGGVRWRVVSAPANSRLRRRTSARQVRAQASAAPLVTASSSLTPSFEPDVLGRYVLRMTAGSGALAVSDSVTVDSVPRSAFIPVDTADDSQEERPGIRVGSTFYAAPWMVSDGGVKQFSGKVPSTGIGFQAVLHVLALERTSLAVHVNRTYGLCAEPDGRTYGRRYVCRSSGEGRLLPADMEEELAEFGAGYLVIATAHRSRPDGRAWLALAAAPSVLGSLISVGLPDGFAKDRSPTGTGIFSLVGVPTMPHGEAEYSYDPDGRGRLRGYLNADEANNFGFVPGERVPFDTRSNRGCVAEGCAATQTVGDTNSSHLFPNGTSGYLVSVYDPDDLRRIGEYSYATGSPDVATAASAVQRLAFDLKSWTTANQLVAVTSLTTPGKGVTTNPGVSRTEWAALSQAIAAVGGTRDTFNKAAGNADSGYALLGWGKAGEGAGNETTGKDARLRGALVPNGQGHFRPLNVSADGPPADRLQRLIVREPEEAWPLDDEPGPRRAFTWLGSQISNLGEHPRSAYWHQGADLNVQSALNDLGLLRTTRRPTDAVMKREGFTADDFDKASSQLTQELIWVGKVRDYFGALSKPYEETVRDAFAATTGISDRLEAELKVAKEHAEARASWFELVKGLLSFAGGFEGFIAKDAIKHIANLVIEVSASAMETSSFAYEGDWDGSREGSEEEIEEDYRVTADELGAELARQANASLATFKRMGNAIVSDYSKLAELGTYAKCNTIGRGCDDRDEQCAEKPGGCQDYTEYAVDGGAQKDASSLARVSMERTIYRQLVTLSSHFPVWDTGVTRNPEPIKYTNCTGSDDINNPFYSAPARTWTKSLEELDPSGRASRWRVFIMVARSSIYYSYPSAKLLDRMFEPVNVVTPDKGGLGMSALDVVRAAKPNQRYVPGGFSCWWRYPTGLRNGAGQELLRDEPQP